MCFALTRGTAKPAPAGDCSPIRRADLSRAGPARFGACMFRSSPAALNVPELQAGTSVRDVLAADAPGMPSRRAGAGRTLAAGRARLLFGRPPHYIDMADSAL